MSVVRDDSEVTEVSGRLVVAFGVGQPLSIIMFVPATAVQPVERQDMHKSCRTIETLLSALHDYCEAASAFAAIQKKLSKALRDTAGLKTNAQFAGQFVPTVPSRLPLRIATLSADAFGASSVILEVLADVDSKFAKMAEKESHTVSSEVKKWFKKLAVSSLPTMKNSTTILCRRRKRRTMSA